MALENPAPHTPPFPPSPPPPRRLPSSCLSTSPHPRPTTSHHHHGRGDDDDGRDHSKRDGQAGSRCKNRCDGDCEALPRGGPYRHPRQVRRRGPEAGSFFGQHGETWLIICTSMIFRVCARARMYTYQEKWVSGVIMVGGLGWGRVVDYCCPPRLLMSLSLRLRFMPKCPCLFDAQSQYRIR